MGSTLSPVYQVEGDAVQQIDDQLLKTLRWAATDSVTFKTVASSEAGVATDGGGEVAGMIRPSNRAIKCHHVAQQNDES